LPLILLSSSLVERPNHPDENQSGRTMRMPTACGPGCAEMRGHPPVGANLRRALNPMSAARRARGKDSSPIQAANARAGGSGTPRRRNATVHDPTRATNEKRWRLTRRIARERDRSDSPVGSARADHRRCRHCDGSRLAAAATRRLLDAKQQATTVRTSSMPLQIRQAKNRKGDTGERKVRGRAGRTSGEKRRSGIVRRPAAPDSASRPQARKGKKPQERPPDEIDAADV